MKNKPNPFTGTLLIIEENLQDIFTKLKAIDNTQASDLTPMDRALQTAIQTIDQQHAKRISTVLSALAEYEPGVVYAFADSQPTHQVLGWKILELSDALVGSCSSSERATTIAALIHHFNKYSIAIHENLSREEATLLPLLQRYYNERELANMQMQIAQDLHAQPSFELAL